jgi:2-hydroxychromene-2-carboxylate isomerase
MNGEANEIQKEKIYASFYYDILSPFCYFYILQLNRLQDRLDIKPIPILLGGLLRATNNLGPAEVAAKRPHTYQYCVWLAEKLGIRFRFPERHPFPSVAAQRLLVQEDADWTMITRACEYVWVEGKDPNLSWAQFCLYLGLPGDTPKPSNPVVKTQLISNTEQAKAAGAFGVPSLVIGGHCFWGLDTIAWVSDYLNRPNMFAEPAFQHAREVPSGLE